MTVYDALISAQAVSVAALAVFVVACWTVLDAPLAAAAVAAPVAFLIPWTARGIHGEAMAALALASACVWLSSLHVEKSAASRNAVVAMAAVAVIAVLIAPPTVVVLLVAAAGLALRRRFAVAALVALLAAASFSCVVAGVWSGRALSVSQALRTGWSAPMWYASMHDEPFLVTELIYSRWFWWPIVVSLCALLFPFRRDWWFLPTILWASSLALSTLLLGRTPFLQHSLPLQFSLLAPLSLSGLLSLRASSPSLLE